MELARAPLLDILAYVEAELVRDAEAIELDVLDPDLGAGCYAGELVEHDGARYVHRPFRVWVDLAERLGLRLCMPRALAPPLVRIVLERLDRTARVHADAADPTERYGTASVFARIHKLEDPGFVLDLTEALDRVAPPAGARVLDLGVNTGDELALLLARSPALRDATIVGVDHSASAIARARERFAGHRVELHVADVGALAALGLGRFDLVLSIGTLQSAGIDDRELVRRVVQDHLAPGGAVIFGFPNCRYVDGEVEYGARMKNFRQPELGLLVKDVAFYRKYLQQHRRQVFVTGKHYVLVTGVALREVAAVEQDAGERE
ncbi:MAG TPA: class I SAM-dependent methyltransferase [Kofleriaceae bacterium]|nr:class I SAM-dependent methyltransferase [Kofleriaceae bacterium]